MKAGDDVVFPDILPAFSVLRLSTPTHPQEKAPAKKPASTLKTLQNCLLLYSPPI